MFLCVVHHEENQSKQLIKSQQLYKSNILYDNLIQFLHMQSYIQSYFNKNDVLISYDFFIKSGISYYISHNIKKHMKPLSFQITLTQHIPRPNVKVEVGDFEVISTGAGFWDIETDLQPIYENFNILSYFSPTSKIRIHDVKKFRGPNNVYQFSFNGKDQAKYYLFELEKDDYEPIYKKSAKNTLKIRYSITSDINWPSPEEDQDEVQIKENPSSNKIQVQFSVVIKKLPNSDTETREIVISIYDQDSWILNNIYPLHYERRFKYDRISQKRRSSRRRNRVQNDEDERLINQNLRNHMIQIPAHLRLPFYSTDLEYFYIQPESQRAKVINKNHFALALQGGGCKGVTYIGAYKAILDHYKNSEVQITSIIGSSAGGIIGLAICCKMTPNKIIGLCEEYLSRVTDDKTYPQKNQDTKRMVNQYMGVLEGVFRDFNIFDEKIIEAAKKLLLDKEIQQILYQSLSSGLKDNDKVLSLFDYQNNGGRNICGLLNGKLMTGQKVADIAVSCLIDLVENGRFKHKVDKYYKDLKEQNYKQWAQTLTMKQLYDITGIEFTCTSVDVTNHILRYFNHKTTPNLPVVNAVQMTGAFPVAFQATYWKKEWGKYYIHYDNIRREVDLEGCKFTDGGMLANFPIDCIDNEEMRPMYFSHVKDSSTTMFGVGLQQCQPLQKQEIQNPQQKKSLGMLKFVKKIGIFNSLKFIPQYLQTVRFLGRVIGYLKGSQEKAIDITNKDMLTKLRQIPLFDFGFNLLLTYTTTKDKLAEQSFRHRSYQVFITEPIKNYIYNRQQSNQFVQEDIKTITGVLSNTLKYASKNPLQTLLQNLKYLTKRPVSTTQEDLYEFRSKVEIMLSNLMFNFLFTLAQNKYKEYLFSRIYQIFRKRQLQEGFSYYNLIQRSVDFKRDHKIYSNDQYKKVTDDIKQYCLNRIFYRLQTIKNAKIFVMSDIRKDYETLLIMVQETQKILNQIYNNRNQPNSFGSLITEKCPEAYIPEQYLKDQRRVQEQKIRGIIKKIQNSSQKFNILKQNIQQVLQSSDIKKIFGKMQIILKQLSKFEQLKYNLQILTNIMNNSSYDLDKIKDNIRTLSTVVNRLKASEVFNMSLVCQLVDVQSCFLTYRIQDIQQINDTIQKDLRSCIQLIIGYRRYNRRGQLSSYVKRTINQSLNKHKGYLNGLHIVFQQGPYHEIYFFNVIQALKRFRVQMRTQETTKDVKNQNIMVQNHGGEQKAIVDQDKRFYNVPITSITMSNIQSIAAILYASDLSQQKINKYSSQIKWLVYENDNRFIQRIQKRLKQGEWAQSRPILLKKVTQILASQISKKNIFAETQSKLNKSNKSWDTFKNQIKDAQEVAQDYRQKISQILEQSLNSVIDSVYQIDMKNKSDQEKIQQISTSLSLKYQNNKSKGDVATNQTSSKLGQILSQKFAEAFKYLIESSSYISQQLVINISKKQKKDAWKGLILGEVHSVMKIKDLVQSIMLELGLSKNTTLQEFYRVSSKKITLNFTVINTKDSCIQIYNHETRPYMPVWAAVVASSSLIQFYRGVPDKSEWSYKLVNNLQQRKITTYFKKHVSNYSQLYSADSLRKLPIDLLTNSLMCKKMYSSDSQNRKRREAFLIFDFSHNERYTKILKQSQKNSQGKNIIKVSNINAKDILNIRDIKGIKGLSMDYVKGIPILAGNSQRLQLYVNSHDKLIMNLYKNQLINLPIRLGTLDFHLMCEKQNNKLTRICNDTIMQSYFAMKQKMWNQEALKYWKKKSENKEEIEKLKQKWVQGQLAKLQLKWNSQKSGKQIDKKDQIRKIQQRWENQEVKRILPKDLTKLIYFRIQSKNKKIPTKKDHKLVVRFLSKLVPNKSSKQDYKIYFEKNQVTHQYLRINTYDLALKFDYVDINHYVDQVTKNRQSKYKIIHKFLRFDLTDFTRLVESGKQFGYVYCLKYTDNHPSKLQPEPGFMDDYRLDFMFDNKDKDLLKYNPIVRVSLQNASQILKYERPLCKLLHPLKTVKKQTPMYGNKNIKMDLPYFNCQKCTENKNPQNSYSIRQKYQIRLMKDNSIKCTVGDNHELLLRRKLSGYPYQLDFVLCDRCGRCNPVGFFNDKECEVDICFTCVFEMIKDEQI